MHVIFKGFKERDTDVTFIYDSMEVNSSGFYKTETDVTNKSDHVHTNSRIQR